MDVEYTAETKKLAIHKALLMTSLFRLLAVCCLFGDYVACVNALYVGVCYLVYVITTDAITSGI